MGLILYNVEFSIMYSESCVSVMVNSVPSNMLNSCSDDISMLD